MKKFILCSLGLLTMKSPLLASKLLSDSAKFHIQFEINFAKNNKTELIYGHYGGFTRVNSREFITLGLQKDLNFQFSRKKQQITYGGIVGWYNGQFLYKGYESAKSVGNGLMAKVEKLDTFGYNVLMILPTVGYSYTPGVNINHLRKTKLSIDAGFQISIPVNYSAASHLDSTTYQTNTIPSVQINHTVRNSKYEFNEIPRPQLYLRFSISNSLKENNSYSLGYRIGYSRNFTFKTSRDLTYMDAHIPFRMQGFEFSIFMKV